MTLILNIDTSSPVCSVCLSQNGQVLSERNDTSGNQHASGLTTLITEVMNEQGLSLRDLSAVALSSGPGSYTGLRIGASVAKGICYGLDKPLISVLTLQGIAYVMAERFTDENGVYIAMLDARRDDVYMATYDKNNIVVEKDNFATASVVFPDIMRAYNVKNVYFGGPGALKMKLICLNNKFGTVIENLICVGSNINAISYNRYVNGDFEDLTYFEPFYLKEFEGRMKIN